MLNETLKRRILHIGVLLKPLLSFRLLGVKTNADYQHVRLDIALLDRVQETCYIFASEKGASRYIISC